MTMSTWVYGFGAGRADGTREDARPARRQGREPRRDVQSGTAGAAGLHHHDRGLPLLLRPRPALSRRSLREEVRTALRHVEETADARLGDPERPLLVSVRSGAPVSMPGMMDTVLNLGLNDRTVEGLAKSTGDPRFAYDSYRRFIQMYGDVVLGVDHYLFEDQLDEVKRQHGYDLDTELGADELRSLIEAYQEIVEEQHGAAFPQDVEEQLWGAIGAVFGSWMTPRAVTYRRLHDIDNAMGTAVNVQAMVFGNRGERSATGRRLHPRSVDRREALLRRVPGQCPGRGRGRRDPHAAAAHHRHEGGDRRQPAGDGRGDARRFRRARHSVRSARGTLPRHAGHRVHRPGRPALDPADPQRQAHHARRAQDRGRHGGGGPDRSRSGGRQDRSRLARPAAAPDARPRCAEEGDCQRAAGVARRGLGQGGVQRRRRRAHGCRRRGGAARARRDLARGHPRHACGQGHPDLARRHDQPRRGGRARHGQAVRVRRGRAGDRLSPRPAQHRHDRGRRRRGAHDRRQPRRGHPRRRADRRPQALGRFRDGDGLGGRAAPAARARQCRHAGRCPHRAPLRRRGHRPVPHRAHVLRRRPHPGDARDDPRRQCRRAGAPRSPRSCRCSARTSSSCSRSWAGCR